ncbi:type II toxin-antitoxin system RelE/ParE family toxin [Winogradskyella luteola]|uniref:Type II toxin-antitoxin system RelE/ParE family toxin n=1 Tax=Winogradskyella luteola TaxID=2828330 RepID=A0A9X1F901_9FLAO|nr:type II toxin-antitoxin system RelE/ParE family toxin [Winogradskyella luteola]MBV7269521.1 type II toxin-antitoxin system RelE/ParE family toxin [Winogradskyella luteola]
MEESYEFSDEARLELYKAECYFKLIDKENEFLDDLINQLRLIISMPRAFQERYKAVRIIKFEYFNYTIHYKVRDNNSIIIYRVINQSQDY